MQEVKKAMVRLQCLWFQPPSTLCTDYAQSAGKAKLCMTTQLLEDVADGASSASEFDVANVTSIAYGGTSSQVRLHNFARLTAFRSKSRL